MLASDVMDRARTALNDADGQVFTNSVLLPYLRNAWEELQSEMNVHSLPISYETTSALTITAGATSISTVSSPPLPTDLLIPYELFERRNSGERWVPMEKRDDLFPNTEQETRLYVWSWNEEEIKLVGSTENREVLIRYLKSLPSITSDATNLLITGALLYLAYKTAAEAAGFIGQNSSRATTLEAKAKVELDKFIAIRVKAQQGTPTRRKPYSNRGSRWPSPLPY